MIERLRIPSTARHTLPALAYVAAFATLFALYFFAVGFLTRNSDNAGIVLEAQAMLHGNLTLRGWYLPPDSFITTEVPLEAILNIFYSGKQILHITPALLYAAAVTTAAYLASSLTTTQATRWLAAGACVALIAFPIGILYSVTMIDQVHLGTILAILIAWLCYARFVLRPASIGWLIAFVAVAGLTITGDPLAEVMLVAPTSIVCAWVLWRTRGGDCVARALLGGALVALLLGMGLRQLLILSGAHIASATVQLASPGQIAQHVQWLWIAICTLFHIDVSNGLIADQRLIFDLLNLTFLAVGVAGFVRLFRHTLLPSNMRESFSSVLSWSILCGVVAFTLSDFATDLRGTRYLLPAFVSAGILCASAITHVVTSSLRTRFVLAFLAVSVVTAGAALARQPAAIVSEQPLSAFLEDHHMTTGLGSYWSSDITIVESGGALHLIPVTSNGKRISLYRWQDSQDWLTPKQLSSVTFIVDDGRTLVAPFKAAVLATFGEPDHIYTVGQFTIFAWERPFISPQAGLT